MLGLYMVKTGFDSVFSSKSHSRHGFYCDSRINNRGFTAFSTVYVMLFEIRIIAVFPELKMPSIY